MAERGDLFSVSGAHRFLRGKGVSPLGHIESDPRPHKAQCIEAPNLNTAYFLASACDRTVFNLVHGSETFIFHVTSSPDETNLIASWDRDSFTVDGGTNVGMAAIGLGTVLGYRHFSIYGMDCSFKVEEKP